ncbi:MAG TPA: type II secretion system F family protein [Gammaproteobacteria bacterium]
MTTFRYKSVGADGRRVDGEMDAPDAASVIVQLRTSGHLPISAEPKKQGLRFDSIGARVRGWRDRVRATDVTAATRELATLLNAGIPLDASLRLLERHAQRSKLKAALSSIHDSVQAGRRLSAALAAHDTLFDSLYVNLIKSGEASGSLANVLERLADHRERADAFRSSVVSALTYPIALAAVAVVSLLVLVGFVIPRFIPLFEDAGAPLPLLTQAVFGIAGFLERWWWALVAVVALGAGAGQRWLARAENRRKLDAWLLRVPLAGELVQGTETVRFMRTLETLLRNGLPLLAALKLTKGVQRNGRFAAAIETAMNTVRSGGRLAPALASEHALPSLAVELMTIGEESGQLEAMLGKAAETFEARVEQKLKRLLTLLEPALILGLGAVIALVIVSILMAMLGLNELVA